MTNRARLGGGARGAEHHDREHGAQQSGHQLISGGLHIYTDCTCLTTHGGTEARRF